MKSRQHERKPHGNSRHSQLIDIFNVTGRGEFIIVLDSQDRENEGDLIIAAEDVTTEKMAFMIRYTRYVTIDILGTVRH